MEKEIREEIITYAKEVLKAIKALKVNLNIIEDEIIFASMITETLDFEILLKTKNIYKALEEYYNYFCKAKYEYDEFFGKITYSEEEIKELQDIRKGDKC